MLARMRRVKGRGASRCIVGFNDYCTWNDMHMRSGFKGFYELECMKQLSLVV